MINKFKRALKVGLKNKESEALDVEQVDVEQVDIEQVDSQADMDKASEEQIDHTEDKGEDPQEATQEDQPVDTMSQEQSEESDANEFLFKKEESLPEEEEIVSLEGVFKKEKDLTKSAADAGIPVDEFLLKSLVDSTLKQFAPIIIKKGIRLEIDGLDKTILTNEEVILFIFQEILSNAVNSLTQGCIKIYMREDVLVFEDTGYGIPAEEVALIFDEGFMASNAAPSDDLEGMGMYKCSIALDKMNYGYEVKSTQGVGTTFSIDLSQ